MYASCVPATITAASGHRGTGSRVMSVNTCVVASGKINLAFWLQSVSIGGFVESQDQSRCRRVITPSRL